MNNASRAGKPCPQIPNFVCVHHSQGPKVKETGLSVAGSGKNLGNHALAWIFHNLVLMLSFCTDEQETILPGKPNLGYEFGCWRREEWLVGDKGNKREAKWRIVRHR